MAHQDHSLNKVGSWRRDLGATQEGLPLRTDQEIILSVEKFSDTARTRL